MLMPVVPANILASDAVSTGIDMEFIGNLKAIERLMKLFSSIQKFFIAFACIEINAQLLTDIRWNVLHKDFRTIFCTRFAGEVACVAKQNMKLLHVAQANVKGTPATRR